MKPREIHKLQKKKVNTQKIKDSLVIGRNVKEKQHIIVNFAVNIDQMLDKKIQNAPLNIN